MSVITLSKDSQKDPKKYRVDYSVTEKILGDAPIKTESSLPIRHSPSKITIVGAGFGGICSAISCIKKLNEEDFLIIEKYPKFGGTWIANTYPGVACDVPSIWYSISYELVSNWSKSQSAGEDIAEYCQRVVKKWGLEKKALLGNAVTVSTWNEEKNEWELEIHDVETGQKTIHTTKILVNCLGGLVHPKHPEVPGLQDVFKGEYVHSAMWRDVPLKGKNVLVLGNGCSGTQFVPAVLRDYDPASVTQIARSKHHIMPPLPSILQIAYNLVARIWIFQFILRFIVASSFEAGFPLFKGNGLISRVVRGLVQRRSISYMKKNTPKEYHDVVIPQFKVGCKRLIIDHAYLKSLHDPRMHVTSDPVDHFVADGAILKSGKFVKADVVVACTGYDIPKSIKKISCIGRGGAKLQDIWKDRITAYQTMMVKDQPNMFLVAGPNSASGHASVIMAIENNCTFWNALAKKILDGDASSITIKDEAYYKWFEDAQRELGKCVYGTKFGGCVSWYNEDYNYTTYPYSQVRYWREMNNPKWNDFDIRK
ncbi:hypothetical protein DICA0_D22298 [Diutina catenulata]